MLELQAGTLDSDSRRDLVHLSREFRRKGKELSGCQKEEHPRLREQQIQRPRGRANMDH